MSIRRAATHDYHAITIASRRRVKRVAAKRGAAAVADSSPVAKRNARF